MNKVLIVNFATINNFDNFFEKLKVLLFYLQDVEIYSECYFGEKQTKKYKWYNQSSLSNPDYIIGLNYEDNRLTLEEKERIRNYKKPYRFIKH